MNSKAGRLWAGILVVVFVHLGQAPLSASLRSGTGVVPSAQPHATLELVAARSCSGAPFDRPIAAAIRQVLTVTLQTAPSRASLIAWRRIGGCWQVAYGPVRAWVGYGGITRVKHEGDGATPAGVFTFQSPMYGNAPNPGVEYPYRQLHCGDWWDEDSTSPAYNTLQVVPCSMSHPPFADGSSEALWTERTAYPSFAVINYNPRRVPGAGSGIFLHASVGGPTDGCVALARTDLDEVLAWMNPRLHPQIMIGTN